ncbi:helix-turn-helix domain-containing protein [Chryseobacterium oryctis]|uniref:Helix-turn-helix domain-containing protein n=1 Tax=Chryseobacterium oryctis TaxID=2952618 RepID=A0ABT3HJF4_9FLAO|nr:helix-turn-helix domain-containing protein [Chryseobacterium oryctis]MCW3159808.1 helix-turn-helix domain-containing protein [Chryseobacterium oryctis]
MDKDFTEILKKSIKIYIFLLFSIFVNGQSSPDFNILADKAFQKLYQNPDDCINYSLSILISDQNIEHRIVLRNIISQAYAMKGDYVQAVNISSQNDESSEKEKLSYFMQVFANYSLADQYQNLDLYNQSQKIISTLLTDKKLLNSDDLKIKATVGKLYQLQALNLGIKKYNLALENLNKSDSYLNYNNEENFILKIENRIFSSVYLMRQNKMEEAKNLLEGTLLLIEQNGKHYYYLKSFVYENLARYYFLQGNYTLSIKNSDTALSNLQNLPYNTLKARIYELLAKNYFALHNDEKYHEYNKLYTETNVKIDTNTKEGIRYIVKLVENYHNKSLEFQQQNELKNFWIITTFFSLAAIILLIYFLSLNSKSRDLKKQSEFFVKQKKWESTHLESTQKELEHQEVILTERDTNKISKEKEDEILQKLEEWELSHAYLSKSMSLSTLSVHMGVNTKYLSEVINSNKGKNFNGYINELRINHIAHLLKTNPTFLNYKVSYLAEFSGFSSHSAFTTIFKSITGMSPNAYIQEISKNRVS